MENLTDKQIDKIIITAEVEMEDKGEVSWTTSQLLIRALKQVKNNSVLDDVKVCDRCDGKGNVWYFPDESNFHTEIPCPKCRS